MTREDPVPEVEVDEVVFVRPPKIARERSAPYGRRIAGGAYDLMDWPDDRKGDVSDGREAALSVGEIVMAIAEGSVGVIGANGREGRKFVEASMGGDGIGVWASGHVWPRGGDSKAGSPGFELRRIALGWEDSERVGIVCDGVSIAAIFSVRGCGC